jgi:hypothetical protein
VREGGRELWLVVMKSISMNPRYLASYLALYFLFFVYHFSHICSVVFRVWRLNDRLVDGFVSFCNFFFLGLCYLALGSWSFWNLSLI